MSVILLQPYEYEYVHECRLCNNNSVIIIYCAIPFNPRGVVSTRRGGDNAPTARRVYTRVATNFAARASATSRFLWWYDSCEFNFRSVLFHSTCDTPRDIVL